MDIRDLRKRAGVKVKAVAAALGVTKGTIDHYEQGTRSPKVAQLPTLCKLFNCSEREIIEAVINSKARQQK